MNQLVTVPDAALAERLQDHAHQARGALAENTVRALRADSGIWSSWCVEEWP